VRAVQQQTQTIPIVFAGAGDVLELGIVKNVARPEGNTTGVTNRYNSLAACRTRVDFCQVSHCPAKLR